MYGFRREGGFGRAGHSVDGVVTRPSFSEGDEPGRSRRAATGTEERAREASRRVIYDAPTGQVASYLS